MSVGLGMPRVRRAAASDASLPADRPATPALVDTHGRTATDLRISLTDRCNLRCTYCMPAEGLPWLTAPQVMSADEVVRLARIGVEQLGVTAIRLTGGEPLLRRELLDIVRALGALDAPNGLDLAMTTNAVGLASRAQALRDAGLQRLNVSLDTIDEARYAAITRRPQLGAALAGIHAARAAGYTSIKLNAVITGDDDHERDIVPLTAWALEHGLELRFIEQMPLDADHRWSREALVSAARVRELLGERYRLVPHPAPRGGAPADRHTVLDAATGEELGTVGIIASVTEPFCGACARTRLTAEGRVRSCLFGDDETDLLAALRGGSSDDAIADLWRGAMWAKRPGHGIDDVGFLQPTRTMSAIGG